jgi:hypothetical protein
MHAHGPSGGLQYRACLPAPCSEVKGSNKLRARLATAGGWRAIMSRPPERDQLHTRTPYLPRPHSNELERIQSASQQITRRLADQFATAFLMDMDRPLHAGCRLRAGP